jgi:zinc transport system ATP-binding protein
MSQSLVSIRDLRVNLGDREILRGVTAELRRGGVIALIGLNGAGKSTLLRALVKEVPYTGNVEFHCGHDHRRPAPEHVGYVPQRLRLEANLPLTVLDLFGISLQRKPLFLGAGRKLRAKSIALLEEVKAAHLLDAPVEKLSGGELQRVLLSLAMDPRPELLLLDEPAAGIDFQDVAPFYDLIAELNRKTGVTILLVSHDLNVVGRLADHVLCLAEGRIHCQGPPQEIGEMVAKTFGPGQAFFPHSH